MQKQMFCPLKTQVHEKVVESAGFPFPATNTICRATICRHQAEKHAAQPTSSQFFLLRQWQNQSDQQKSLRQKCPKVSERKDGRVSYLQTSQSVSESKSLLASIIQVRFNGWRSKASRAICCSLTSSPLSCYVSCQCFKWV